MKQLYKDPNLEPLFKRREELRNRMNKDMTEYKALEYVISKCRSTEERLEDLGKELLEERTK